MPEILTWNQIEKFCSGLLGLIYLGFGVSIVVGGAIRFPPPTYEPLLNFTGNQVWPYGLLFLAAGIAAMIPDWRVRLGGVIAGAIICDVFAALFLIAVVKYPDAGGTAWWAYFCFGGQSSIVAALILLHRMRRTIDRG